MSKLVKCPLTFNNKGIMSLEKIKKNLKILIFQYLTLMKGHTMHYTMATTCVEASFLLKEITPLASS